MKSCQVIFDVAILIAISLLPEIKVAADPLSMPAPLKFDGGPLGELQVQGILSGAATWQDYPVSQDDSGRFDVTNAQLIVQKNTGSVQFFVQGGAYNFPTVGVPLSATPDVIRNLYGPIPEAYIKWVVTDSFSIDVGKLPTLVGAESAWTWSNYNIERGLLWNLENTITRGVQFSYAAGPINASLAWTDGFYSGRYNTLSGSLSWAINSTNTFTTVFYDNLGNTPYGSSADPEALNNSQTGNLIYAYSSGPWVVSPYLQYIYSPKSNTLGYTRSNDCFGAAVLADYSFSKKFSLGARIEYLTSSGAGNISPNNNLLGYGPGSRAWTFTLTPTWQEGGFFARAEISYVRLADYAAGLAFGEQSDQPGQLRGLIETGVMF
ncbi:MAG: outer membrane beta-barrel protein [Gammaproteobacteria bacterium]